MPQDPRQKRLPIPVSVALAHSKFDGLFHDMADLVVQMSQQLAAEAHGKTVDRSSGLKDKDGEPIKAVYPDASEPAPPKSE